MRNIPLLHVCILKVSRLFAKVSRYYAKNILFFPTKMSSMSFRNKQPIMCNENEFKPQTNICPFSCAFKRPRLELSVFTK